MQMDQTTRFLPINLQFFAEGGDGGAGGSNTGSGNAGGTQDPNAGGQGGGQQTQQTKVTFTPEQQAELERILGERLSRAEKSAAKRALEARAKELGFESVEAMEAALKAAKEAAEKEKTDLQRAQEAKAAAEAKAKDAEERAKRALIKAAFAEAAIAANLVSVDDAFLLADLSGVEVDDAGKVTGIKEAVEKLVREKPYLVRQGSPGGAGGGNPTRSNVPADDPAERGRQMALKRNQEQAAKVAGLDPWTQSGASAGIDVNGIAQAVAAAVAAALKGQGNA